MSSTDDQYEQENDQARGDAPSGDFEDNDYQLRQGQKGGPVPVTTGPADEPIDAETADSDETLAKDDADAIDESNIIEERTRGAAPEEGAYTEPGDDEGLGGENDGQSRGA